MKLKTLSALCLAASTLAMTSTAMAWESEDGQHSTSASVALSSEYIWRGISQTDGDPAISGSFDYAHSSGFYA
ncbi:MAG TPA: TorF family putative porin, partial [Methylophaga sp.]|nr:TorF family putative porin [Methylophaga sp.]